MDAMDDFVDGRLRGSIGVVPLDVSQHLAKVRVAGSNPVVRSKIPGFPISHSCILL